MSSGASSIRGNSPAIAAERARGFRLQQHERDLVLASADDESVGDADFELMAADYKKILEPVTLASRRGYGFIEAAEVYSGILGVMN